MVFRRNDSTPSAYAPGTYRTDPYGRLWLIRRPLREHQLYSPPAWCIDSGQLAEARSYGAEGVVLKVRDTGQQLYVTLEAFGRGSFKVRRARGAFGEQRGLFLEDWSLFSGQWPPTQPPVTRAHQTAVTPRKAPAPVALRLWAEDDEQPARRRGAPRQQPWLEPFE